MTAKRDFKRRVRERQSRTGESYVTARRRLLAARAAEAAVPVVELSDATQQAALLGFRCRVTVFPSVLATAEIASVLASLRDALVGAAGDPATARMFGSAFGVASGEGHARESWPFPGWIGRASPARMRELEAAILTFQVAGRDGPVDIECRSWNQARTLVLMRADDIPADQPRVRSSVVPPLEQALFATSGLPLPKLFAIVGGRRTPINRNAFVIGDGPAGLEVRGTEVATAHAAVVHRNGAYYVHDLGSTLRYRGLRIGSKRIEEGDAFELRGHEVRFTYLADG